MKPDLWHYARLDLAKQILNMFESNLSSALVFFAARRMGKTEFLCKDIQPLAEKHRWKVFYFSFFDTEASAATSFTQALLRFTEKNIPLHATRKIFSKLKKVSGKAVGIGASIELENIKQAHTTMREIMEQLSKHRVLLLLDEVQMLAEDKKNIHFIAAFRTALDLYKENIKVIFTGSSQEGLRKMFSQAKAPFFHFGQNLPFPELDVGFTNHLSNVFHQATQRQLDKKTLWNAFIELQKIPQLARNLVEKLALQPNLSISTAKTQLLQELFDSRAFTHLWGKCSLLERLLLKKISANISTLFSQEIRAELSRILGTEQLSTSTIQSAIRTLQRKHLIGRHADRGSYYVEDPNLKNWLLEQPLI
jgi:hypothetical protein